MAQPFTIPGSPPNTEPCGGPLGRDITLGIIGAVSQLWLTCVNTVNIKHHNRFLEAVTLRPAGQGLITVANHASTLDDPALISAMLPLSFLWSESQHEKNRWTMCAREICFKNAFLDCFFRSGKTLPVDRGAGTDQPSLTTARELASNGSWIHVFPEGRVSQNGEMRNFKWGIGKMLCEAAHTETPPMVVPFYHRGMEDIKQIGSAQLGVGKTISVVCGEPIPMDDLYLKCRKCRNDQQRQQLWKDITDRVKGHVQNLKGELDLQPASATSLPSDA
ncbi:hypothetical protein CYMTET_26888 [Cymbomonas tetramitiformis]|uniref:Tafazzin family protein n=1 Tax=Cymbomonas tetramitiformis TaxID=36881 RepID=A0AAE0KXS7_9CHLO|nr:hypothetical protein CYMTET_26888 [Cymbomonas tetramitiformis]